MESLLFLNLTSFSNLTKLFKYSFSFIFVLSYQVEGEDDVDAGKGKRKKKAAYAGGLVLDPKVGKS